MPSTTAETGIRQRKPESTEMASETTSEKPKKEYENLLQKRGKGEKKWKKFMTRLVFGWALVFFFFGLLYSAHVYVILFIVFAQASVFRELVAVRYNAEKAKEVPLFRTIQWCWFIAAMFHSYGGGVAEFLMVKGHDAETVELSKAFTHYHNIVGFAIYSLLFVVTVLHLKKGCYTYQMGQLAWTVCTIAIIVVQLTHFVRLVTSGMFWYLLSASLVVCNDTFAYFCGFSMGKKLIKRTFLELSPNKTWEGFIGGGICTIIFAFWWPTFWIKPWLVCPIDELTLIPFQNNLSCEFDPIFIATDYIVPSALVPLLGSSITCLPVQWHSMVLAIYASVFAPFGGFFASAIKRAYNKKDFDSLIPGHGGFMDRLDCQFLMIFCTGIHLDSFVRSEVSLAMTHLVAMSTAQQQEVYQRLGALLA